MKKLLLGLAVVGLAFNLNAAETSVYGSLNYMISNSDDATGNPIMKAENNGSKIGVDFTDVLQDGATGIKGFAKLTIQDQTLLIQDLLMQVLTWEHLVQYQAEDNLTRTVVCQKQESSMHLEATQFSNTEIDQVTL